MRLTKKLLLPLLAGCLSIPTLSAYAGGEGMYAVTITNITRGVIFTPILVATHKKGHPLFMLGSPASDELVAVAESGNTEPLADKLTMSGMAYDTKSSGAPLFPGKSVTVNVMMHEDFNYVSVVSMMLPTNDGFIAVNGVKGPNGKKVRNVMSAGYDAGSETNDEQFASIPGPFGGEGLSPNDHGEGYVHIHGGIHGIADVVAADHDWRNPTAKISIKRMK